MGCQDLTLRGFLDMLKKCMYVKLLERIVFFQNIFDYDTFWFDNNKKENWKNSETEWNYQQQKQIKTKYSVLEINNVWIICGSVEPVQLKHLGHASISYIQA